MAFPDTTTPPTTREPPAWWVFALAAAYAATGYLGLMVATVGNTTLFWPPTGIALAVLFRAGLWLWPGVFLGAFVVNLPGMPVWAAAGVAVGNTLAPVAAVRLLQTLHFDRRLRQPSDLFALLFAGGLAAMLVSSASGAFWLWAAELVPAGRLGEAWLTWWLGDTSGVIAVAPPVLAVSLKDWRPVPWRVLRREAGPLVLLVACCTVAFTDVVPAQWREPFLFLPFFALIWVGLRHSVQSASAHLLVLAVFAVCGTANGVGVFGHQTATNRFVLVWAVLTVSALVTLLLTTIPAQRDKALAALVEADDYLNLLHGTPAMMCRYTADGTITFANRSLCRFLGQTREQLVGRSVLEFLTDLPRLDAVSELQAVVSATQPISHLGPFRRADGAERWHRWTAHAVLDQYGHVHEYHAVGVDITERRRAEEERQAIERKMLEAQRLESLGVLAGGVAHGFNNLFAGILGHAELAVAGTPPGAQAQPHLDVILKGVKEASGLTRQLLAYSGKGKFLVRPVRFDQLVRRITPLLRVTIPKSVELDVTSADVPPVAADESQLRQVIVNLVTNAGEAIGDGPGTITVTTASYEVRESDTPFHTMFEPVAPGRYAVLRVSDTGCGMDELTRARLFDPFFTTKFAGRGLGMPAVLGIVRAHRGGISVASKPGAGTVVTVYLPVCEPDARTAPEVTSEHDTPPTITVPVRTPPQVEHPQPTREVPERAAPAQRKVLVVDDEDSVRRVAQLMLEQLGYAVTTASDGVEAVEVFTREPDSIQAVLLDMTMPRMDGAEVLAAIREIEPRVPVVLCSGFTEDAIPTHLSSGGVTGFLQKPFTMLDLGRQIRRALGEP
ncbi:MAG TPA: MASE1 domain-containing protein [Gemmataceae bacterium]|nr:MASE1 domain-containing protein [Gemmataceae bacterium]